MKTIDLASIQIYPITTEEDFVRAGQLIDSLIDADMIEDEQNRNKALAVLNAVTILASEYEKNHHAIPKPDPIESIKQRMLMLNLSQKDIAKYFGGENRTSEVLNRRRPLSLKMIRALHSNLGIPTDVLIG